MRMRARKEKKGEKKRGGGGVTCACIVHKTLPPVSDLDFSTPESLRTER